MAVEQFKTKQETEGYRGRPLDDHGKLRIQFFELDATTVAGDAGTTVDLCTLPPGAVRIIPTLCRISHSDMGASRTFALGHRAYMKRPAGNDVEAEDLDALLASIAATPARASGTLLSADHFDVYSLDGVTLTLQVNGGTMPVGATVSGFIVYAYE